MLGGRKGCASSSARSTTENGGDRREVETGKTHLLMLMGHRVPREKGIARIKPGSCVQSSPPMGSFISCPYPRGPFPEMPTNQDAERTDCARKDAGGVVADEASLGAACVERRL